MSLTPESFAEDLLGRGYVEVQEFGELKVGSRVRHTGQRWSDAIWKGTGNIERIFQRDKSSWTQKYGKPDVEVIVKKDAPDEYSYLADYHVALAESSGS